MSLEANAFIEIGRITIIILEGLQPSAKCKILVHYPLLSPRSAVIYIHFSFAIVANSITQSFIFRVLLHIILVLAPPI